MYFKKALSDADVQWAEHKRLISTTERRGDIAKVIPGGFSYFHADFRGKGGYAHVIENAKKFPVTMASVGVV